MQVDYLIIIAIYFLPSIISIFNPKSSFFVIFTGNLLLSWTVVYWFGSLIWAFCDTKTEQTNTHEDEHCPKGESQKCKRRGLTQYVKPLVKWWRY